MYFYMLWRIIMVGKLSVVDNNYSAVYLRNIDLNNFGELQFEKIKMRERERNKTYRKERNEIEGEEKIICLFCGRKRG